MSAAGADPWVAAMRRGDFATAWTICDRHLAERAGRSCTHLPRHLQDVWDGTPLDGRHVLVRCYHGLGDTLQFIRYMPSLAAVAREVTVWAQPKLLPLLRQVPGVDRWLPLHDGTPGCRYDADVELMELPHVFRTTLDTIPAQVPYLRADPLPLPAGTRRPAVGLVWQAGEWDARRSIPIDVLAPLAALKGIELFILQPGAAGAGWRGQFGTHLGEMDVPAFARAIAAMDLVVTIDSMPAHLAGALGLPTWTLLPHDADWRWMAGRDDSPWYPTMRLFRQPRPGDWAPVVAAVAARLGGALR